LTEVLLYTADAELLKKVSKLMSVPQAKVFRLSTADCLPVLNKPDILILDMRTSETDSQQLMSMMDNDIILLYPSFWETELRKGGQWQFARILTIDNMERDLIGMLLSCTSPSVKESSPVDYLSSRSTEILNLFRQRFWTDVILEIIPQEQELLDTMADGILLEKKFRFAVPILIKIKDLAGSRSCLSSGRLSFHVGNLAMRYINVSDCEIISLSHDALLFLNYIDGTPSFFADSCKFFVSICEQMYSISVACYVGRFTALHGMPSMVRMLEDMASNNVGEDTVMCLDSSDNNMAVPDAEPPWVLWKDLLVCGKFDEMLIDATEFLRQNMRVSTEPQLLLIRFVQDYSQMLYGILSQQNISAHTIFNSKHSTNLMRNAPDSLESTLLWMHFSISLLSSYINGKLSEKTAVAIVSDYIEVNLSQKLSRQLLADAVHFSPGHLTRLFKKELGLSVSEYIAQRRLLRAEALLIQTDISVTEIAEKVGYTSYSAFFSKFKAFTGLSPTEYRSHQLSSPSDTLESAVLTTLFRHAKRRAKGRQQILLLRLRP